LGVAVDPPEDRKDVAFVRHTTELRLRPSQLAALATKGHLRHA
jgi:hypothetical protein